ncbi:MAG TPA: maleylacetoacetate isomerase [Steroidobacteraceae bacterium]|nr:maleylacetoacetate isomerase [Steroidobacteraceae bacterium]
MSTGDTLQLYSYFRSSAAFRVRIALHVKGLAFDTNPVALLEYKQGTGDYLALNPQGLVPALYAEGTVLPQSLAIIEYLEERHPQPPLLPREPVARALVRSMALAVACDIHPLNNLRVLNYLREHIQLDKDSVAQWSQHWIATGFAALETQARIHSTAGRYCYGDALSIADVCLAPQMLNARRLQCDLGPYPTLTRICGHLETLPAFVRAAPENQPDAK